MLVQGVGGVAYNLICALVGLITLGMSANEWHRLSVTEYGRRAVAAGILLLVRLLGALVLLIGWASGAGCQEGFIQGLTVVAFTWAFLHTTFATSRQADRFLAIASAGLVGLYLLCLLIGPESFLEGLPVGPWPIALLVLAAFALVQWIRNREHLSMLLAAAFLIWVLASLGDLFGLQQLALLGHLAALPLFAAETYRNIHVDLGAYGSELQAVSEQALRQTQDMAFLLEVSQAVGGSLDLSVVLDSVSESVARAVNADWAYILLPVNSNKGELAVAARYGWWGKRWMQDNQFQRKIVVELGDYSLLRHAILRRRQVLANLPEDYEQFESLHTLVARPQSGPTLIQPIHVQDRSLGVVLVGHVRGQRAFTETDGRLCRALASQVARAIDNARLYQSVDEQARRLAQLLRLRGQEAIQRQAILESIADGVVVAGESGEVVLTNAAAERILGLSRQQLMGQAIKRLYAELLLASGRKTGKQAILDWGDKIVMGSLAPVRMPDGTVLGHVAVFRDVTRERQAEQAKNKFVAAISHDLRTPMTSIKGYIELLATGVAGDLNAQQRHFLDILSVNTEKMVGLVNNLIAASEMERGIMQIERVPVDIANVIREAVRAARPEAAERSLDLMLDLPPDLGTVRGDPGRLRQVMDNLLDNALRFTPQEGRINVWAVEASLDDDGATEKYVVVNIRDTGVGIPPEEHGRIFDKFYQVENAMSDEAGGSGMGLAIVKNLVEAHGGRVWVESEVGVGSTFSFVLPATTK